MKQVLFSEGVGTFGSVVKAQCTSMSTKVFFGSSILCNHVLFIRPTLPHPCSITIPHSLSDKNNIIEGKFLETSQELLCIADVGSGS